MFVASNLIIRRVESRTEVDFAALIRLYEDGIPPAERKQAADIRKMLDDDRYAVWVASCEDELVGFAIVFTFQSCDLTLLEYMAVDSRHRGTGIGKRLFSAALDGTVGQFPMILEVESDHVAEADLQERTRRKHFYRQLGCREIEGLRYILPLGRKSVLMDILVGHLNVEYIDLERVLGWLSCLYEEVYGQSRSDPRIEQMTVGLPACLRLV